MERRRKEMLVSKEGKSIEEERKKCERGGREERRRK